MQYGNDVCMDVVFVTCSDFVCFVTAGSAVTRESRMPSRDRKDGTT